MAHFFGSTQCSVSSENRDFYALVFSSFFFSCCDAFSPPVLSISYLTFSDARGRHGSRKAKNFNLGVDELSFAQVLHPSLELV